MSTPRIEAALRIAADAAHRTPFTTPSDGRPRTRRFAIGDPQADITRFLAILDRHGLLAPDGLLKPEVQLISVGDHFDWGKATERDAVATSSVRLLAWMAAHPADQLIPLLGNHDLSRVGELAGFTDARFARVQEEADRLYRGDATDEEQERDFLARYPEVPNVELISRDFGTFREEQREWVKCLLRTGRFRVAHATAEHLLVLHAGVTREDLLAVGLPDALHAQAATVAETLNRALDEALNAWDGRGPFSIPSLYQPGNAIYGEGRGIFYQRPSLLPEEAALRALTPRRRFDPRRLPLGLTQVVGHTRDKRCRELLALPPGSHDGVLRHLVTDGATLDYRLGPPPDTGPGEAVLIFTDGGMRESPLELFELLDLDTGLAARPVEDTRLGGRE